MESAILSQYSGRQVKYCEGVGFGVQADSITVCRNNSHSWIVISGYEKILSAACRMAVIMNRGDKKFPVCTSCMLLSCHNYNSMMSIGYEKWLLRCFGMKTTGDRKFTFSMRCCYWQRSNLTLWNNCTAVSCFSGEAAAFSRESGELSSSGSRAFSSDFVNSSSSSGGSSFKLISFGIFRFEYVASPVSLETHPSQGDQRIHCIVDWMKAGEERGSWKCWLLTVEQHAWRIIARHVNSTFPGIRIYTRIPGYGTRLCISQLLFSNR